MENIQQKITETLKKFSNKGLYQNSALFHNIVYQIARGVNEYQIIENLIEMMENQTLSFQNFIQRDTRPIQMRNGNIYKVNYDNDVINELISKSN